MKQQQNINFKLPAFSWLFSLFLLTAACWYQNNSQLRKPVQVEQADRLISESGKEKNSASFFVNAKKIIFTQNNDYQKFIVKFLSKKLDKLVHLVFNKQSFLFQSLLPNILLHFSLHVLPADSADDFPDFIV